MRARRWPILLLGLVMLVGTAVPRLAAAKKKRVVVLPFSGPLGSAARRGVLAGLKRKVIVISPKKFSNTADDLGADEETPEGLVGTCSKIRCDAVIKGSVRAAKRRRYKVVVTVYNGGTGTAIGRRAATVRGKGKVARAGTAIGRGCLRLVAKGRFAKAAPAPPPPPPPPTPVAKRDTSDIPVFKPTRRKGTDDDDDDDGRVSKSAAAGGSRDSLVDLSVSMGMAFRRYVLEGTDPLIVPNKYEGGMYPEFTIRADIFPLTPFIRGIGGGLGIGVAYTRHLTISTKPRDNADSTVDTSSQELFLDLKWRWGILARPTSPWVTVVGGFGMRDFSLGQNKILTSFNYRFLRVGLDGGFPLWTPLAALTVGFDVRPLLGIGEEAVQAFGSKTGGLGFSGRVGLSGIYRLSTGGVTYFVNFEYLRFTAEFTGLAAAEGGPYDNRDGFPDRQDASSGTDRFIRLWVGAGYSY